jgi:hypothetical protein
MMLKAWLSMFVMWAIGAAAFTLLCSDLARWTLAAKLGLSFGIGLVVLSLSLFLASLLGVKPAPWIGLLELIVLGSSVAFVTPGRVFGWIGRKDGRDSSRPGWARSLELMLTLLLVGIFVIVAAVTLLEPIVEWDVMGIWALKAKVLLHESVMRTDYFRDFSKAYSHTDYPLLWPFAMAWIWSFVGEADLIAVKVLAIGLLGSAFLLFFGLLRRKHTSLAALLFSALLAGIPIFLAQTSRLMCDPPFAVFVLGTFVCVYFWLESGHCDDLRIAGVLATGMLFTKNEGLGFWFVLILVAAIAIARQKRTNGWKPAALWLAIIPLFATCPWFLFRSGFEKTHENYGSRIDPIFFFNNLARLPEVFSGWLRVFLDWHDWLILWSLALSILAISPRNSLRSPMLFLILAATLPVVMYSYIYVVSPWNLKELMESTANRLLLQVAPLWVFFMAEQLRTTKLLFSDAVETVEDFG